MDNFTIFKFGGSQRDIKDFEDRREVNGEVLQMRVKHEKEVQDNEFPSFHKYRLVYEDFEEVERMEVGRGEMKTRNKFVLSIGDNYELDLIESDEHHLSVETEEKKVAEYLDFLLTTDGYLLLEQSSEKAVEFLKTAFGADLERITIDLQTLQQEFESLDRLQANFSGHPTENISNVKISGSRFKNSTEYLRQVESSTLESVILKVEYQEETTTLRITRGGKVRAYSPFNYPSKTAVKMVSEKISPHILTQSNLAEFQ